MCLKQYAGHESKVKISKPNLDTKKMLLRLEDSRYWCSGYGVLERIGSVLYSIWHGSKIDN